jgi:transcriptional regulator with XRE-family HTH domain
VDNLTSEEWESRLGDQVRRARIAARLGMDGLAEAANVSTGALRNLEHGRGSTLTTLVKVARVLGRQDWLDGFAPEVTVSPMAMLARRTRNVPQRVRSSRRSSESS